MSITDKLFALELQEIQINRALKNINHTLEVANSDATFLKRMGMVGMFVSTIGLVFVATNYLWNRFSRGTGSRRDSASDEEMENQIIFT